MALDPPDRAHDRARKMLSRIASSSQGPSTLAGSPGSRGAAALTRIEAQKVTRSGRLDPTNSLPPSQASGMDDFLHSFTRDTELTWDGQNLTVNPGATHPEFDLMRKNIAAGRAGDTGYHYFDSLDSRFRR